MSFREIATGCPTITMPNTVRHIPPGVRDRLCDPRHYTQSTVQIASIRAAGLTIGGMQVQKGQIAEYRKHQFGKTYLTGRFSSIDLTPNNCSVRYWSEIRTDEFFRKRCFARARTSETLLARTSKALRSSCHGSEALPR